MNFRRAAGIDAFHERALRRAELSDEMLALDPTQQGLRPRDRFEKSRLLLANVVNDLLACAEPQSGLPDNVKQQITSARAVLASRRASSSFSDSADENVALARNLWSARLTVCSTAASEVLKRIMSRLASR
jgi:hypothetical protein